MVAATEEIEFGQSIKKFVGKPLYCRILKNLTPEKPPQPPVHVTPDDLSSRIPQFDSQGLKLKDNLTSSVKEKTKALEVKADDKKSKQKLFNNKLVEYGLTNTTAQQTKRNYNDVGSPTSPDINKSPKKPKAGDKTLKK